MNHTNEPLERGRAALAAGDWIAAREAFEAALAILESPDALEGLADAQWWLGETSASVDARERAYAGYRKRPDPAKATDVALALTIHFRANVGDGAVASGWLARARRLVDEHDLVGHRGWIELFDAGDADSLDEQERRTREALAAARAAGDIDMELCALAQLGSILISLGRIDEGTSLLDESMAGSLGGEGGTFDTVVFTSCNMIGSCTRCADFERAVQWIRAADRFTERYGCPFLYLYCRTHYGAILIATGDWAEAEEQLTSAMAAAEGEQMPLHYFAAATLASLRLAQGRLEEAQALIEGFGGAGPAAAVEAGIHLARGDAAPAAAVLRRTIDGADRLSGAELGELLGTAELTLGRPDEAIAMAASLIADGASDGCDLVRARGARLHGRATGEVAPLDTALSLFLRLGMPLEAARTRLLLASVQADTDGSVAITEARAALAAFESLGAGRDADEAAALLRRLGVKAARLGPKGLDVLTKRENEVLELLAEGLSNPKIAERLFLSRKTVEHHVASILTKTGASNRAEAVRLARNAPAAAGSAET